MRANPTERSLGRDSSMHPTPPWGFWEAQNSHGMSLEMLQASLKPFRTELFPWNCPKAGAAGSSPRREHWEHQLGFVGARLEWREFLPENNSTDKFHVEDLLVSSFGFSWSDKNKLWNDSCGSCPGRDFRDELRALAPFSFHPFPFPVGWLWDCWGWAALDALSGKLSPKVPLDLAVGSSTGAKKSISKILMEKNGVGGAQEEIWLLCRDW